MSKAFVDTTILANSLLKDGEIASVANDALKRFDSTELPVYAIKEFKAGPLLHYKWFHNKLALLGSFDKSLLALHAMSLTPKKYTTATALEALRVGANRLSQTNLGALVKKYGTAANPDTVLCDQYRLTLKAKIFKAWRYGRQVTTATVIPLSCFNETGPYEQQGQIELENLSCSVEKECCLAPLIRERIDDLKKLRDASLKQPESTEKNRRVRALKEIIKKPKAPISAKLCRNLGDAWFALFAPQDAIILTTNVKDHSILAGALNKRSEAP